MTTHITVGRVPPDFAIPDVSEPAPSVPTLCNWDECCGVQKWHSDTCKEGTQNMQPGSLPRLMSHTRDTTPPSVADTAQSTPAEPAQTPPVEADR